MATWNLITRTFPLLVHRIKSGGVYPARIEGMSNVFVGDTDPGVAMDEDEDYWANPDFTSLATVVSAANTPSSGLWTAIRDVSGGNSLWVSVLDGFPTSGLSLDLMASGHAPGLILPANSAGATGTRTFVNLPPGWTTMVADIYWAHEESSPTGNVRWNAAVYDLELLEQIPSSTSDDVSYSAATEDVDSNAFTVTTTGALDVNPAGGPLLFRVVRLGHLAADTFDHDVHLLGVRLRKAS